MNDLTLSDIGFIVLLSSLIVRVILIGVPTFRFVAMFGRRFVEGAKLFKDLDIPGLGVFVKQECMMGFLPYLALYLAMKSTSMSEIRINGIGKLLLIITGIIMVLWIVFDWYRSYLMNRHLEVLRGETDQLRTITGNVLDGLRYIVYLRGSVTKVAVKLGTRAAVGVAKKKVDNRESETGKRSLARVALTTLDKFISFPERIAGHVTNWMKDVLDEKFRRRFKQYSERTTLTFILLILWSLLPAILLTLIAQYH